MVFGEVDHYHKMPQDVIRINKMDIGVLGSIKKKTVEKYEANLTKEIKDQFEECHKLWKKYAEGRDEIDNFFTPEAEKDNRLKDVNPVIIEKVNIGSSFDNSLEKLFSKQKDLDVSVTHPEQGASWFISNFRGIVPGS
ncbi:MAG: hypothetical protein ACJAZX_000101 [Rickettsiales bacterium]|jgi:hypothetical protein